MSKYSQVNWYVRNAPKSHDYSAITQVHTLLWFVLSHMFCWATVATSRSIDPRFCLQRFCRWVASPKQSTPPLSHSSFFLTSLPITFRLSVLSCLHFFPPSPPLPLSKQKRDQVFHAKLHRNLFNHKVSILGLTIVMQFRSFSLDCFHTTIASIPL